MDSQGDPRNLYLTEKIANLAYNAKYHMLGYFQEYAQNTLIEPTDQICILGSTLTATTDNLEDINKKIYQIFVRTPWITYRAGFPELPNQIKGSYVSDTGWGCMVRVGQMLFAQIIKKHQGLDSKEEMLRVLQLFSDCDKDQPFSIQNIAKLARIEYGLKPGDWYNPAQIAHILAQLHQRSLAKEIKLAFCVFNSGNLFFDLVLSHMTGSESARCQCHTKRDHQEVYACPKCNKTRNSIAIIILSRLGLNAPQPKYLGILDKLIQLPQFQGILGGKPKKALYFVGKHKKQYIYLDPHYVQSAERDVKAQQNSYFCASFRKCNNTSIDSSLGICFYLRNLEDLNDFRLSINRIKNENLQDFFIFISDKTPDYSKKAQIIKFEAPKQEIFEAL